MKFAQNNNSALSFGINEYTRLFGTWEYCWLYCDGNLVESRYHLWHFISTSKVTACYFGVRLRNWPLKPSWKDLQYKKLHTVKQLSNSNRKPFLICILICQRRKRKSWKWYFVSKILPSSCEGKNVLVIEKNFWNLRLKANNLKFFSNSERSVQFLKPNSDLFYLVPGGFSDLIHWNN